MASNLASSKHDLIIFEKKLKTNKLAEAAEYSEHLIKSMRLNIRYYGTTKAPPNSGGRSRLVIPLILNALCEHFFEKPRLWDEFDVLVSIASISRAS
jgi:hypothetical protein